MGEIEVSGWVNRPTEQRRSRKEILERRRKRRRQRMIARAVFGLFILICLILILFLGKTVFSLMEKRKVPAFEEGSAGRTVRFISPKETMERPWETVGGKPELTEDFLTENPYSRPGEPLERVDNIFIHYTANPGTTAAQNRSYFESLGQTGETSASAHFVIGLDGEIIQCLPLDEIGYAVKTRNYDSISVECCYSEADGSFSEETYQSLLKLTGWLLKVFELEADDVWRHYDVGGKKCPLYYVENEEEWQRFLDGLETELYNNDNYY